MTILDTNTATKTKTKTKAKVHTQPPVDYKVIYLNDEVTSIAFVVDSLVTVFDHSDENADQLATKIHEEGRAVVAVLPYEIAEQKGIEVTVLARNNQYPLQVTLEPAI